MRRYCSTHRLSCAARRLTVVLGLIGFLVANTGLPVVRPVAPRGKDKSKPFLCQDRPCGCMSADECLRGCCCFTASQRLAWALENHVDVPPELLAAVETEHSHDDEHDHAGSCCSTAEAHKTVQDACATCDTAHADAGHELCQHSASHGESHGDLCHADHHECDQDAGDGRSSDRHSGDEDDAKLGQGWRVTFIMGPLASHCRGLGPLSVLSFSALPPVDAVSYQFDWSPAGWLDGFQTRPSSVDLTPPTRPPCASAIAWGAVCASCVAGPPRLCANVCSVRTRCNRYDD